MDNFGNLAIDPNHFFVKSSVDVENTVTTEKRRFNGAKTLKDRILS